MRPGYQLGKVGNVGKCPKPTGAPKAQQYRLNKLITPENQHRCTFFVFRIITNTHTSSNLGLMVGSLQSASLISGIWSSKWYSYEFLEQKQHEK